mgnify:CR=1 FL=1
MHGHRHRRGWGRPRLGSRFYERDNVLERWDHASVHEFEGSYGDYVLSKVSKVFPVLRREVL